MQCIEVGQLCFVSVHREDWTAVGFTPEGYEGFSGAYETSCFGVYHRHQGEPWLRLFNDWRYKRTVIGAIIFMMYIAGLSVSAGRRCSGLRVYTRRWSCGLCSSWPGFWPAGNIHSEIWERLKRAITTRPAQTAGKRHQLQHHRPRGGVCDCSS